MTDAEARLRAAARAAAATVAPDSTPPLRLPPGRRTTGRSSRRRGWRLAGWLTPLAAAGAALAVVIATETAGAGLPSPRPARPAASVSGPGIPPYYVVVPGSQPQIGPVGSALLRETATGRLLATIRPPAGGAFTAVAGNGHDRTFVLAARVPAGAHPGSQGTRVLRFFRLGIGSRAGTPQLTALPVEVRRPGAVLTGLALTPDGSRLAISLWAGQQFQIRVFSLAGGPGRTWAGARQRSGPGAQWVSSLSWAADDRTLAYSDASGVSLLDTAAPGTSLPLAPASSRGRSRPGGPRVTLACLAGPGSQLIAEGNGLLTADGGQIIGITRFPPLGSVAIAGIPRSLWQGGFTYPCPASALRTVRSRLRPIRYGTLTGIPAWLYWVSPAGRALIVVARFGLGGRGLVGVLRGDRFTPLAGTSGIPVAPAPPDAPAAW